MARYTGPKTRICRIFGEPILGNGKYLTKNSNPPGQHGPTRKRKAPGEYALQLKEKQKAKYTYGVLEKQFRKTFEEASRIKGVTGENLMRLLEARLDNTVYRLGVAPSRPAARQLVAHKHITVKLDDQLFLDIFRNALSFRIGNKSSSHLAFVPIEPSELLVLSTESTCKRFV